MPTFLSRAAVAALPALGPVPTLLVSALAAAVSHSKLEIDVRLSIG